MYSVIDVPQFNIGENFYASFVVTHSKVPLIVILLSYQEYHYRGSSHSVDSHSAVLAIVQFGFI